MKQDYCDMDGISVYFAKHQFHPGEKWYKKIWYWTKGLFIRPKFSKEALEPAEKLSYTHQSYDNIVPGNLEFSKESMNKVRLLEEHQSDRHIYCEDRSECCHSDVNQETDGDADWISCAKCGEDCNGYLSTCPECIKENNI